jgi:hypothetical protein
LLLAAYGLVAAVLNGIGLWKFGPSPFVVFEELLAIALVALVLLGLTRRVRPRWVWGAVVTLVLADCAWRLSS